MTAEHGIVLITGTSSGIGLATAVAAARAGYTTVATMREPGRAGALLEAAGRAGVSVDVRRLDVTDPDSVAACVDGIERTYGRLDAVVNNAGISNFDPTMEMSTMAALRANLDVNFFGVVEVSRAAMPLLRVGRGRLVTIGSVHGVVGQPFNEAYCAAKFAVEGFMESLAPVAEAHGVQVSVVVPGFVRDTSFGIFPDINRKTVQAASGPYAGTFADYVAWIGSQGWAAAGQLAQEVAEVVVRTLRAEQPPFRVPANQWAADYLADKLTDGDGTAVQTLARTWIGLP
ncbi:NAD(P)-dependent dehydrogenase (short-subunit alcohol dehydrogenase family) [Kitasatospora gansuensis]|uniref:NAD(P)-dependent dehydrogenase (Short-subunit alcohol dehydrogenase family) n=1 Tax=Kitasatospora gansuensis TaxID=258050 RepID=A0A7W7WFW0_9ACTN|nr:SDR family NAD(P)-dependent oxidoreductase [Kitasatospora gansuensis]MBB4944985.1 NAD(P)-dependent dehydrogenase (short-subunit alcohol dehydrogenase family) [Kitasatospora gansuensis]